MRAAAYAALVTLLAALPRAHAAPPPLELDGADPAHQIASWDAAHGVSSSARWRSVMSWRSALHTPFTWSARAPERAPARYPTSSGRSDPAADLAASIVRARAEPDFACHFPLRAEALADLGVIEHPTALLAGDCPEFEAWARLDLIDGVELVYASPSFAELATSAGHILFRVRSVPGPETAPAVERVLSYGVDLSDPEVQAYSVFKGLVGALRGEVLSEDASTLDWRYARIDLRDLLVYDLVLDSRELRRLLARMWVQARDMSDAPYSFFSVNCARLTHDTLRAAIPQLPAAGGWFMHPHEVLTELWRADRLRPRGVVYSWRSRARRGEQRRARIAAALASVPGFTAAHEAAVVARASRGAAYATIAQPSGPALQTKLARWADATLDVELYLADRAAGPRSWLQMAAPDGPEPAVATPRAPIERPALDQALRLRARLPPMAIPRLEPFPPYTIGPSGSRRVTLGAGFNGAAPTTRARFGVVDEQPGEARAIGLRRSGRYEFMLTDLTLAWPALDWPAVDDLRLIMISTADYGLGVRSVNGALAARLFPIIDLGLDSAPRHGVLFGGWLRVGEGLTLAAAEHDLGFWVIALDAQARFAWLDRPDSPYGLRGEIGALTEIIAPIGNHHLRLDARLAPGWALDGYALHASANARLDLLVWPARPLLLSPYGRWRAGDGRAGWEAGLSLSL